MNNSIIADGEVATFTYQTIYTSSTSKQKNAYHCCDIMTFKEGKIIRVHEYTSLLEDQTTQRENASRKIALDEYRINILADDLNDYFSTKR